jgi:hypothetical protein
MTPTLREAMRKAEKNTENGRSPGKDIRATLEELFEDKTRDYLDLKAGGSATADKLKTARGIVRGLAIAWAIMNDPDRVGDEQYIKDFEREFVERVKD